MGPQVDHHCKRPLPNRTNQFQYSSPVLSIPLTLTLMHLQTALLQSSIHNTCTLQFMIKGKLLQLVVMQYIHKEHRSFKQFHRTPVVDLALDVQYIQTLWFCVVPFSFSFFIHFSFILFDFMIALILKTTNKL